MNSTSCAALIAACRFPSEKSSNEKGNNKGINNQTKDDIQRAVFLQRLRKMACNGSFVFTGYGVINANSLAELKGKVIKCLQGRRGQAQQQQGQQRPGGTDEVGGAIPQDIAADVERELKGVQTHLQYTLEAGLLYQRAANGLIPIDILAKSAPVVKLKDVKQKLEFAQQRRQLYLPYSPFLTELAQKGWDVPPLGLLLRLGAADSFRTAGNDIVRYREIAASNQFQRKLRGT